MHTKFVCVVILMCSITLVYSAPQFQAQNQVQPQQNLRYQVVKDNFHQDPNLEYNFEQEFSNGETFSEDGKLRDVNGLGQEVIVTKGTYTIVEPDGSIVIVNYTADEYGFHPEIVTTSTAAPRG